MLLCCAGLTIIACKKDEDQPAPVACFVIEHEVVNAGETAHFTSCATDAHHFEWNFGDAATSPNERMQSTPCGRARISTGSSSTWSRMRFF